jgi:molecular chaperone DnaJ
MSGIRDALLIATGSYQNSVLTRLRSPAADADQLAAVLEDPEIGWFQVQQLLDAPAYQIAQAIERFFQRRSADDLLVLHLSCHGIKDDDGALYFAAADTDPELLASTAVPASFLQGQLDRCRAKSIVVLLDCCYSGAFLPGMKGGTGVDANDQLTGTGRAVLTASSRTEYAWESDRVIELAPEPSKFTEAVVHGLRTGEADRDHDGQIGVDELYQHVYERLRSSGARQTPRLWTQLDYRVLLASSKRVGLPESTVTSSEEPPPGPQRRARRGSDTLIRVDLTLRELVLGAKPRVTFETLATCGTCKGLGTSSLSVVTRCGRCSGYGETEAQRSTELFDGLFGRSDRNEAAAACDRCHGFGTLIENPCDECHGDGRIQKTRSVTISLPKGLYEGARVRVAGQGETGPGGGPAGDLFLEVAEDKDDVFTRLGQDLHCTLTIPAEIAGSGGVVTLDTFDGPKRVRVPAGAKAGQQLRIAGLGVPRQHDVQQRGDLYVKIATPAKALA